jgi:hypothetical protein
MLHFVMLFALLIGAALAADGQTVWWRTPGASVIGFPDTNDCSLFLSGGDHEMMITWSKDREDLGFSDSVLQIKDNAPVSVAVQIGDTWIQNLAGSGTGNNMFVPLPQSVDPLIAKADHVTLKVPGGNIRYDLPRGKMPTLLKAVHKCRKTIR